MNLSSGLNVWTAHVQMRIYEEIHRWFVYKAKKKNVLLELVLDNYHSDNKNHI